MTLRVSALLLSVLLLPLTVSHADQPAPVIVTRLQAEPFVETIEALGTLRSNEAITLTASVTDIVSAIHFEDGQRVKQGDVLVEMISDEERALVEAAGFALEEAKRQYNRVRSLAKTNLATESLLDERLQAYQSAQAQLSVTESRLADRTISAPFSGVLGLRNISAGSLLRPGDVITTLDDDSYMKLDVSIPAVFLNAVRPGLSVNAHSRELPEQTFTGEITAVDSRIDPDTRSIQIRALLPNPQRELRSGLLMTVRLEKPAFEAILLPEESLVQEGFKSYVYRVDENSEPLTVSKVEVETGPRRQGEVVIEQGLSENDLVVTHGVMRIKHNSPVSIRATQQDSESLPDLLNQSTDTEQ